MADKNKAKFMPSFFHVGPEQIEAAKKLTEADFQLADEEEKESVIQRRKSVSYWRDAFRRFRENTVSMVALFVFFIIVLFTFVGPMLIPYDYSSQYRTSAKLSPMDNSEDEKAVDGLLKSGVDAVYATLLQPGSLTALRAGDYYFNFKGETYSFSLDKNLAKASIVVDLDQPEVLSILTDKNLKAGTYTKTKPLAYTTGAPSDTANEIKVVKKIFPHVFGTDTAGRDIMARTMYGGRVSLTVGITAALIVLVIGATYGSISGLAGGKVDFVMMRIVDVIYSVPDVLIVLLLQVVLKNPLQEMMRLIAEDVSLLNPISKRLYPLIAERYKMTPYQVERNVRYLFDDLARREKQAVEEETGRLSCRLLLSQESRLPVARTVSRLAEMVDDHLARTTISDKS
jgi:oligopeptide transport system permease protein